MKVVESANMTSCATTHSSGYIYIYILYICFLLGSGSCFFEGCYT